MIVQKQSAHIKWGNQKKKQVKTKKANKSKKIPEKRKKTKEINITRAHIKYEI